MFKFKSRFTKDNDNDDNVNVEIVIPLRYLSNFSKTLAMLLINCETLSFMNETALTFAITVCSSSDFINSRQSKNTITTKI